MKKILGLFSFIFAIIGLVFIVGCNGKSGIVGELSVKARRTELVVTAEFNENDLLGSSNCNIVVKLYNEDGTYKSNKALELEENNVKGSVTFSALTFDTKYILKLFVNVDGEEELINELETKTSSSGTDEEDAVKITNKEELLNIANDLSAYYTLENDIDLDGATLSMFSTSKVFSGTFDGNGYTISNYVISGTYAGLFGYCKNATIKDLNVSGVTFKSSSSKPMLGAIVGYATDTTITGCSVDGLTVEFTPSSTISTDRISVGGLIGNGINITALDCECKNVNILVKKGRNKIAAGMFAGSIQGASEVKNCNAAGKFETKMSTSTTGAALYFGGFVGYLSTTKGIESSYSEVDFDLTAEANCDYKLSVGGFVGSSSLGVTNIKDCVAINDFTLLSAKKTTSDATDEYYKLATNANIGGFMGEVEPVGLVSISNCYVFNKAISVTTKNENINVSLTIANKSDINLEKITNVYAYSNNSSCQDITVDFADMNDDINTLKNTLSEGLVNVLAEKELIVLG